LRACNEKLAHTLAYALCKEGFLAQNPPHDTTKPRWLIKVTLGVENQIAVYIIFKFL